MAGVRRQLRIALAGASALLAVGAATFGMSNGHAEMARWETARTALTSDTVPNRVHDHSTHDHGAGSDPHSHGSITSKPQAQPSRGMVYASLTVARSGACKGLYAVKGKGACSHGPDAPPAGHDVRRDVQPVAGLDTQSAATAVNCFGNGTDGNRVQVLYVYSGTSRYQQYLASFQTWARGMDDIYNDSAAKTGGERHIRFVTDEDCVPTVTPVQVSSGAMGDFGWMIDELRNRGFDRTDRKYTVFGDANVYCGIGEFAGDTRKTADNHSNFGPSFARTDAGCWGPQVIAHELGHNLGAVNNNAPSSTGGAHCTDEYDVMCYSDSPYYPPMRFVCAASQESLLDCGNNDYFNTSPPAGSYLANYWNMADSVFLERSDGDDPGPDPDPDPEQCTGFGNSQTGRLDQGGDARVPDGNYYWSRYAGRHTACLAGPDGTDFDLYFQKWNGSSWVTVQKSATETSDEAIDYQGDSGYYRYWIDAWSGSGAWTMGWSAPR
ncbi:hypothetical protein ncot_08555 [Nocardioides sp. JQ2195]|uniref:hypothetical protein n=1 Tax=Nocardioides sp. JQ2195 TaxID=2592334 RepID=UPI00143EBFFC|nr:hypothetical protein [Nocardioides sp. JQ2195]QIX26649.1 hypothetical protein ncot_08555 [Nocardioides sp. JQ2195]